MRERRWRLGRRPRWRQRAGAAWSCWRARQWMRSTETQVGDCQPNCVCRSLETLLRPFPCFLSFLSFGSFSLFLFHYHSVLHVSGRRRDQEGLFTQAGKVHRQVGRECTEVFVRFSIFDCIDPIDTIANWCIVDGRDVISCLRTICWSTGTECRTTL